MGNDVDHQEAHSSEEAVPLCSLLEAALVLQSDHMVELLVGEVVGSERICGGGGRLRRL